MQGALCKRCNGPVKKKSSESKRIVPICTSLIFYFLGFKKFEKLPVMFCYCINFLTFLLIVESLVKRQTLETLFDKNSSERNSRVKFRLHRRRFG